MRTIRIIMTTAAMGLLGAAESHAQVGFGGQLSWGDESDVGLGARGLVDLSAGRIALEAAADINLFFPGTAGCAGCDFSWWEINANVLAPLRISEGVSFYAGGGLNFASLDTELPDSESASETEAGLNLVAGLRLPQQRFIPYIELRTVLGGAEQVVITAGVGVGPAFR